MSPGENPSARTFEQVREKRIGLARVRACELRLNLVKPRPPMYLAKVGPKKRNRKRSARYKAQLKAKNKRRRQQRVG